MSNETLTQIECAFASLPLTERETIIRHGVALRLTDLRKRCFLAESKLRWFAERYHTTLEQLDTTGLPDDASIEMHEDYTMWHHWAAIARQTAQDVVALQEIAQQGLPAEVIPDAGG